MIANEHYPKDFHEFLEQFKSGGDCWNYIFEIRWPDRFVCPKCGGSHKYWITGSTIITDGWSGCNFLTNSQKYKHIQKVIQGSGKEAHELLPHVHMVDSLVKRWINGTDQGEISPKHLPYYLDEFAF